MLAVKVDAPGGSKKYPVVILVHGFGTDKSEHGLFDKISRSLVKENFTCIRFDFSGCGESEGLFRKITLSQHKKDLKTIIDYVKNNILGSGEKLGLFGFSYGAVIATVVAPEVNCNIYASTSLNAKPIISKLFGRGYKPNEISVRTRSGGGVMELDKEFWIDLEKYNFHRLVKRVKSPTLFIHGESDNFVKVADMEELFSLTKALKKKVVVPQADHNFSGKEKQLIDQVIKWFSKYLSQTNAKNL